MTELPRLRLDLSAFAVAVGQPLTRWQAAALTLGKDRKTLAEVNVQTKRRLIAAGLVEASTC